MLKLMIVDDELWIREGLRQTVDWTAHGIEWIGEAEDGRAALALLEKNVPDIVISDIRMPSMDGMELLEEAKRRGIDTKVILISGFSDFFYAQKAVKLGAFDYILKPIEEQALLDIVDRCAAEIRKQRQAFNRMEALTDLVRESVPLAKQKHLELCLSRPTAAHELQPVWKALGIDLDPERLVVLSAVVHDWGERGLNESGCALLRYALGNLMEEIFTEAGLRALACPLNEHEMADAALMVSSCRTRPDRLAPDAGGEQIFVVADRAVKRALQVLGIRISIGVSGPGERNQLFFAFREALTYNAHYFIHGASRVYGPTAEGYAAAPPPFAASGAKQAAPDEAAQAAAKSEVLDTAWTNRMIHAMMLLDEKRLSSLLDEQTKLLREWVKQSSALAVRTEMNLYIGLLLTKWQELCKGKEHFKPLAVTHQMKLQLYRCPLREWKQTVMNAFLVKNPSSIGLGQKRSIDKALRYIHDNFHLGISLNNVAETIYLNPSYFSRMFHEEVGEPLSKYLIRIRISKAKELLEQTSLKIYEIADLVGYKDFRHFVKTFKDWEGMTPAQYRNYGA
ncbi:response regulator transcription factor [Paenibacillus sacheonensis]|uniref:Response regulator n=1 Tax=Paenibacillus sacheonensis TaxID=742054 RepID=A0A7X4YTK6_9BACL|nr:response regulator [Paenibacillus sacheonensis]MBM7568493.1 YesN/AraC family two-component response regulator [Paenibacillus sacheonensis]NBC72320.1 response regulator [Paenibacillus sacheonensis]